MAEAAQALSTSASTPAVPSAASGEKPALDAQVQWMHERFVARARALFYARMMFLSLGLLILAVPTWANYFGFQTPMAFAWYFFMLGYSVANFMLIDLPRVGRWFTYVTLCMDLVVTVILIVRPRVGGGLQSPLLASQLVFTTLFAILYPRPLAILPPLLALPITTRLDLLLNRSVTAIELLTVLWYSGLNLIVVYVVVYLNERESAAHREVMKLQANLKEMAVVEERNRLARDIHDGLGASLSSLIIQSEYLLHITKDEAVLKEIGELKATAEDSIEELRRSLRMMREDFELAAVVEEYVRTLRDRTQLQIAFERSGVESRLPPADQLTLFRVLQESLSNCARHSAAKQVSVGLHFGPDQVELSVRDDGKGFDPETPRPGHYGLLNMRERARKSRGQVSIESTPGAGTTVRLVLRCQAP